MLSKDSTESLGDHMVSQVTEDRADWPVKIQQNVSCRTS
ncbi:hypothetical protein MINT15_25120 [Saccharomonospora viridis]|uniref:Uncharacterized protein n=1 Tax=Saccharomonospora viridis TaxID=1852 RepID=A0A837D823_9PSEU|nr:hypothetical protein MINT15_25120 [Saccharomonospora viridis]